MAITVVNTSAPMHGKSNIRVHTLTIAANGSTSGTADVVLTGLFLGIWWKPTSVTSGADVTLTYSGFDILGGAGTDAGNDDQWIPANVDIGGTTYAGPIPVDGTAVVNLAQLGVSDTLVVEVHEMVQ